MGYRIFLLKSEIFIKNENFEAALFALKHLNGKETCITNGVSHFAFIASVHKDSPSTLEEMLQHWRWLPEIDDAENIIALEFLGEKLGDENILFRTIAPFVRGNSYILMAGEDGKIWRWLFHDGTITFQYASIVFE